MKKYRINIKGIQPLIWNVMKREMELKRKTLKKNEISEWEENRENWIKKAEFDGKGKVIIPDRWLKGSLIKSCKKNRIVPHFATRKNETYTDYITSCMVFNTGRIVFDKKELIEYGAFVGSQGINSQNKVWKIRPMIKKWKSEFYLIDPIGRMNIKELKEILEFAGLMIGIGDNRVNNFGRFEIENVVEVRKK